MKKDTKQAFLLQPAISGDEVASKLQGTFVLKRTLFIVALLAVLCAGAFWWFQSSDELTLRHPDYGQDCDVLANASELSEKVDCVRVWYGTNRSLELADTQDTSDEQDVVVGLGASGGALKLGRADVWLPKLVSAGGTRERGETPHVKGDVPDDPEVLASNVFLTRVTTTGKETFATTLQDAINDDYSDSALLFVHGFNVAFDAALIRAAQLSVDLKRDEYYDVGVPVLFSWPSAGQMSLSDYKGDRDRSLGAAPYLEQFLDILTEDIEVDRINIIAHSMGNRVLTQALQDYAGDYLERHGRDDLEFRIILVAADVERDIFKQANAVFDNLDANVTIYTSDTDRALQISSVVNQAKRLGDTDKNKPFIRSDERYLTVDATDVATELFGIGHGYYSDSPTVLWDIMCAIDDTFPEDRSLREARYGDEPDGERYYRITGEIDPAFEECSVYRAVYPLGLAVDEDGQPITDPSRRPVGVPPPPTTAPPPPPMPAPPPPPEPQGPSEMEVILFYNDMNIVDLTPLEPQLQQLIASGPLREILIEAHTDDNGSRADSFIQSEAWAEAVRDWLISRGVPSNIITTVSYGHERPRVLGDDPIARAQNRRIEVTVTYNQ